MAILDDIYQATVKCSYKDMEELAKKAIDSGIHANDIVNKALSPTMIEVGDKFGRLGRSQERGIKRAGSHLRNSSG